MFYGKLSGTTTPKILSVSPLTTKEHRYKVKKKSLQGIFFFIINEKVKNGIEICYEKTALQIFFYILYGCSLVVNGETDKILGVVVRVGFP